MNERLVKQVRTIASRGRMDDADVQVIFDAADALERGDKFPQYRFKDGHFVDTWNEGVDDTKPYYQHEDGVDWPEAVLELCRCGSPEEVVDAMGEYLERVEEWTSKPWGDKGKGSPIGKDNHSADLLLAYFAADRNLTDHGGSIYGAWLSDAGKRWLELWRAEEVA